MQPSEHSTVSPAGVAAADTESLRLLLETVHDYAIVFLDPHGNAISWNRGAEGQYGYAAAEIVGAHVSRFYPPDDVATGKPAHELATAVREGRVEDEGWRVRKDGSLFWATDLTTALRDAHGVLRGFAKMTRDITRDRRNAEEAVRTSETRLASILDLADDGIISVGGDQRIVLFNKGAERIFGYLADEVLGQPLDLLLPESLAAAHRTDLVAFGRGSQDARRMRERGGVYGRRRDGTVFPAEASISRLVFEGEIRFTAILRDISARVAVEEALQHTKEEAERANAAKSEFLSRMSHELRTPLNAVLGFAQLLEMDALSPPQEKGVAHILKAGRHLLDLINEVLDIARIETGRLSFSLEPVPLREVVREAVDLVRPLAAALQVDLRIEIRAEAVDLHGIADRQRLKQVLLNLLANGVKYNQAGGSVSVSWSAAAAARCQIAVRDTGPGIAADKLDRLFAPFERLGAETTEVEGTGLGLALSRGLVVAMGGHIRVTSAVGEGSCFTVELAQAQPLQEPGATRPIDAEGARAEETALKHTVLYIEDNLPNLELIETVLSRWPDVRVIAAMQGRLGIELAIQHRPDLILLDVHLPDMMGFDVLHALRENGRTETIPVIVISADATHGQVERLRTAGARAYLTKPIDVPKFLRVVRETLEPTGA